MRLPKLEWGFAHRITHTHTHIDIYICIRTSPFGCLYVYIDGRFTALPHPIPSISAPSTPSKQVAFCVFCLKSALLEATQKPRRAPPPPTPLPYAAAANLSLLAPPPPQSNHLVNRGDSSGKFLQNQSGH